jgi:hypothetical protein
MDLQWTQPGYRLRQAIALDKYDHVETSYSKVSLVRSSPGAAVTAEFEGGASVSNEVASVTKNLVGAGVLSLSGGIALYSNDTTY